MAQDQTPVVTKVEASGSGSEEAEPIRVVLSLADEGRASYVLSRDAAAQLFEFLAPLYERPSYLRPTYLVQDVHVDRVQRPPCFLVHFETDDETDHTVRLSEAIVLRLQDRILRALRE